MVLTTLVYTILGIAALGLVPIVFVLFGFVNGFVVGKLYIFFHGSSWLKIIILASVSYPFFILCATIIMNLTDGDFHAVFEYEVGLE